MMASSDGACKCSRGRGSQRLLRWKDAPTDSIIMDRVPADRYHRTIEFETRVKAGEARVKARA